MARRRITGDGVSPQHAMLARILTFALSFAMATPLPAAELLMFDDPGCMWCARWEAEVGPDYPGSPAAAIAPLRRFDLRADPLPERLELAGRVRYTPTFVLVDKGREVGRITGYPGRLAFWVQLDGLLGELESSRRGDRPAPPGRQDPTAAATATAE
jgi:hypothetical protein